MKPMSAQKFKEPENAKAIPIKTYDFHVDFQVNDQEILDDFLDPKQNKLLSQMQRPSSAKMGTMGPPPKQKSMKQLIRERDSVKPKLSVVGTPNPIHDKGGEPDFPPAPEENDKKPNPFLNKASISANLFYFPNHLPTKRLADNPKFALSMSKKKTLVHNSANVIKTSTEHEILKTTLDSTMHVKDLSAPVVKGVAPGKKLTVQSLKYLQEKKSYNAGVSSGMSNFFDKMKKPPDYDKIAKESAKKKRPESATVNTAVDLMKKYTSTFNKTINANNPIQEYIGNDEFDPEYETKARPQTAKDPQMKKLKTVNDINEEINAKLARKTAKLGKSLVKSPTPFKEEDLNGPTEPDDANNEEGGDLDSPEKNEEPQENANEEDDMFKKEEADIGDQAINKNDEEEEPEPPRKFRSKIATELAQLQSKTKNADSEILSETKKSFNNNNVSADKPSFKISEPVKSSNNDNRKGNNKNDKYNKQGVDVDRLLKEVDPNQAEEQKKNITDKVTSYLREADEKRQRMLERMAAQKNQVVEEEPNEEEQDDGNPKPFKNFYERKLEKLNSRLRTSVENMRNILTDVKAENGTFKKWVDYKDDETNTKKIVEFEEIAREKEEEFVNKFISPSYEPNFHFDQMEHVIDDDRIPNADWGEKSIEVREDFDDEFAKAERFDDDDDDFERET